MASCDGCMTPAGTSGLRVANSGRVIAPADQLRPRFEKLGRLMDEAEHDVLAYMTFAAQHRTKLHSTNPLERLNYTKGHSG